MSLLAGPAEELASKLESFRRRSVSELVAPAHLGLGGANKAKLGLSCLVWPTRINQRQPSELSRLAAIHMVPPVPILSGFAKRRRRRRQLKWSF